ncbi:MAG: SMP-30/gluconolactonase/LRE family protein [Spirochaetota bacterium]
MGQTSAYVRADRAFGSRIIRHAQEEQLWTGGRWLEGPVYRLDAGMLVYSDIPNDRMLRWSDGDAVTAVRAPSNYANGNARDTDGRLVTGEHGGRRVTRPEHDGITVLADRFDGPDRNRLFVTATISLYLISLAVRGSA